MAAASMMGLSSSLFFSLSCLESVRNGWVKSSGRITAAAVTGPARHPRPASSVPHSIRFGCIFSANIVFIVALKIVLFKS